MRLKKVPYAKEFLEQQSNVYFLQDEPLKIDGIENYGQIEVEIGCGKGDFILSKAEMHPQTHFFAVEKFDSVLIRAVEKNLERTKPLDNVTFILGDAEHLPHLFSPQSLDVIYLNFSDPWPKTRHAKRRLTYDSKLSLYEEKLKKSGHLEMKTDNQGLFEYSIQSFANNGWYYNELSLDLYAADSFQNIKAHQTEYEKRFLSKGQRIYYLAVEKRK